jgi:hypothetical protein
LSLTGSSSWFFAVALAPAVVGLALALQTLAIEARRQGRANLRLPVIL